MVGRPYSYIGALALGIRTFCHLRSEFTTPNGLVYSGAFYLVTHV
jgi:hypothetical protein